MTDQCNTQKINAENIFLKDIYEQVITTLITTMILYGRSTIVNNNIKCGSQGN